MDSQPAATLASRPAPPEAPQGWSVGWSETHQRWYFVNIETNLTQWKRPEQASQQQPVPTPGHDVNAPTESPLPAGWTSHWSEEHHHFYYLNTATGKSQWEPPLPEKIRDTAELPSQLRPPTQAKHARSSSQPPMRSGSKSEHKQADSTPGTSFPTHRAEEGSQLARKSSTSTSPSDPNRTSSPLSMHLSHSTPTLGCTLHQCGHTASLTRQLALLVAVVVKRHRQARSPPSSMAPRLSTLPLLPVHPRHLHPAHLV
uniref:WW domain-containing protein n=1 Tax=Bionectria ochroleuca TaxID=29856 RepID=A0A8H7K574_BIOOC